MSSSTETRTVIEQIVDNADERELWIVGREFERPPYFHAGKGGDMRLARALRVCVEGRITPNSDGSYTVEGSEHRSYRVADSCSCPSSQKASSRWCYHSVAVAVYIEWQRRLRPLAPVELGTLRAGTLPLPPVTVDERLAQSATAARDHVYDALPLPVDERLAQAGTVCETPDCTLPAVDLRAGHPVCEGHRAVIDGRVAQSFALGTMRDNTALQTHHMPQEDRMADDAYIPEPEGEEAPRAVLEAPERKEERKESPRPLPGPVLLPSLDARTLEQSMQAYAAQRQVVTRYIKEQMAEGVDYYTLTIKGRVSKATLSKAGSEKFLSLFQLSAQFQQDLATWQMLGGKEGLLCYTCTLMTRSGEVVGEGRGARSISQDGGDINKAIKMATKSAQVDAVLRTGALSDVFTQDLKPDTAPEPARAAVPKAPTSQELRQRIWAQVQRMDGTVRSREQVEGFIKARTGMDLHPDFYEGILARLEGRA